MTEYNYWYFYDDDDDDEEREREREKYKTENRIWHHKIFTSNDSLDFIYTCIKQICLCLV